MTVTAATHSAPQLLMQASCLGLELDNGAALSHGLLAEAQALGFTAVQRTACHGLLGPAGQQAVHDHITVSTCTGWHPPDRPGAAHRSVDQVAHAGSPLPGGHLGTMWQTCISARLHPQSSASAPIFCAGLSHLLPGPTGAVHEHQPHYLPSRECHSPGLG